MLAAGRRHRGGGGSSLELHTVRLEFFLTQMIDTTVRGFVYEARGTTSAPEALAEGEQIARRMCERNAIPLAVLDRTAAEGDLWQQRRGPRSSSS